MSYELPESAQVKGTAGGTSGAEHCEALSSIPHPYDCITVRRCSGERHQTGKSTVGGARGAEDREALPGVRARPGHRTATGSRRRLHSGSHRRLPLPCESTCPGAIPRAM